MHTKGPWKFDTEDIGDEDVCVVPRNVYAGNVVIVDSDGGLYSWDKAPPTIEEVYANARLIAAAPDLLEALEYLRENCIAYSEPPVDPEIQEAIEMAEAAIRKAKGSPP